jgi:hypothetical protein
MPFAGEALPSYLSTAMSPWELVYQQTAPRSRDGSEQVVTLGRPYWSFEVATPPLSEAEFRAALAFLDRREMRRVTFRAYPHPDGVPLGAAAGSDGSVTVNSVSASNSTITLGSVGASAAKAGDWVGYYTAAGGDWIGRVAEDQAASGSIYTLKVNPPPLAANATPVVKRTNPTGEFRLIESSRSRDVEMRRITFKAEQVIRG